MRYVSMFVALLLAGPLSAADPVSIEEGQGTIDFKVGGELAARYHIGEDVAKPYFWPVLAPGGVPVTRGWPMEKAPEGGTTDHVHQKSMWFCHGDVIPQGVEIPEKIKGVDGADFWSETKGHGRIVTTNHSVVTKEAGAPYLVTENEWRTSDGKPILHERRVVRLFPTEHGRLFVLEIELTAKQVPVVFGDTKEGSMGVRTNDQLRESGGNGTLTGANDVTGSVRLWGKFNDWIDYSGEVDGKAVGIAVFDDPDNSVRACWHARNYGLLAANPFGRKRSGFPDQRENEELVAISAGGNLKLRYGVYVHTGDAKSADVAEVYRQFKN